MQKKIALTIFVCLMTTANIITAETIRGIEIDFVTIGNARNAADTQVMNDSTTGYGAVDYNYRIGTYEITNAQWNTFTAAAGAPTGNLSRAYDEDSYSSGNLQPTDKVSWFEALQFCNYLTSGDKNKGVYQFSGDNINPGDFLGIDRITAQAIYGTIYCLPTENEWYKAAYYKSDGSGYSLYANGTNVFPIAGVDTNYGNLSSTWNVGTGKQEQNGTFDMMGNVREWNEMLIYNTYRCLRGGGCVSSRNSIASSYRQSGYYPYYEINDIGFRIAAIPEPATLLLLGIGVLALRRKN